MRYDPVWGEWGLPAHVVGMRRRIHLRSVSLSVCLSLCGQTSGLGCDVMLCFAPQQSRPTAMPECVVRPCPSCTGLSMQRLVWMAEGAPAGILLCWPRGRSPGERTVGDSRPRLVGNDVIGGMAPLAVVLLECHRCWFCLVCAARWAPFWLAPFAPNSLIPGVIGAPGLGLSVCNELD